MTQYRISEAAALLGVSDDTVRRWSASGDLPVTTDASGRQAVEGTDLAAYAERIAAPAVDPLEGVTSARNRFVGLVTKIVTGPVVCQVELQCGPHRVVSVITTQSCHDLGLEVGSVAVAAVKSTAVVVQVPEGVRPVR
ncbi:MAG TPA: TOBE domain-containing protein [Microbacteriaceae bacterium]|nr:TOBE domain-containing protein [Microbacteriaceae bacterium]